MIDLKGLLSTIVSEKPLTINLFNNTSKFLIISFVKDGYEALQDDLEQSEVKQITFKNLTTLDVYIDVT